MEPCLPPTKVLFYRDSAGVPEVDWLRELRGGRPLAFAKCAGSIRRLMALGYELRRPEADLLRDGVYELRTHAGRVHYRILYFFHERNVAILAHALTKEDRVPPAAIELALRRKRKVETDFAARTANVEDFDHDKEEPKA